MATNEKLKAIEDFLAGLISNDIEKMPFAEDVVLVSPIDPDYPLVGKRAATDFLRTKVFPKIPVRKAEIELTWSMAIAWERCGRRHLPRLAERKSWCRFSTSFGSSRGRSRNCARISIQVL
jgi:hypothetical protein